MLNSVFFFLEFLTIIVERNLRESVKENHVGVFLSLRVGCLKESKPQLEPRCLKQTCQLSAGWPCNWSSVEGDKCAVLSLLPAWFCLWDEA